MQKNTLSVKFTVLMMAVSFVFSSILFNSSTMNFAVASTNEEQEITDGIENQTDNTNTDTNTGNQETADEQSDSDSNSAEENTDNSIETVPQTATNTDTTQGAQLSQPTQNSLLRQPLNQPLNQPIQPLTPVKERLIDVDNPSTIVKELRTLEGKGKVPPGLSQRVNAFIQEADALSDILPTGSGSGGSGETTTYFLPTVIKGIGLGLIALLLDDDQADDDLDCRENTDPELEGIDVICS